LLISSNNPPPSLLVSSNNPPPSLLVSSNNPPPPLLSTNPPPPLFVNQKRNEPPQLYVKKQSTPSLIDNSEINSLLEQKIKEITAEKVQLDKKIDEISKEHEAKIQKLIEEQEEYKKLIDEEKNRNNELIEKQQTIEGIEKEKQNLCLELEIIKYDKEVIEDFLVQNIRKSFNWQGESIQEFKLYECDISYNVDRGEQYYAEILVDKLHFYGNQDGINAYDENSQFVENLDHKCTSKFKGLCD
jgi:hypothetical protein